MPGGAAIGGLRPHAPAMLWHVAESRIDYISNFIFFNLA
jgi:hypothetical protein